MTDGRRTMGFLDRFRKFHHPQKHYAPLPTSDHENYDAAHMAALAHALKTGSMIHVTGGTNSMGDVFPGVVWMTGERAPYEELKEGDIITYHPEWAVKHAKPGDIMVMAKTGKRAKFVGWGDDGSLNYEEIGAGGQIQKGQASDFVRGIVHRLVQKDDDGWIASGDNNNRSEAFERITPDKYHSRITHIFRYPNGHPATAKKQEAAVAASSR